MKIDGVCLNVGQNRKFPRSTFMLVWPTAQLEIQSKFRADNTSLINIVIINEKLSTTKHVNEDVSRKESYPDQQKGI